MRYISFDCGTHKSKVFLNTVEELRNNNDFVFTYVQTKKFHSFLKRRISPQSLCVCKKHGWSDSM